MAELDPHVPGTGLDDGLQVSLADVHQVALVVSPQAFAQKLFGEGPGFLCRKLGHISKQKGPGNSPKASGTGPDYGHCVLASGPDYGHCAVIILCRYAIRITGLLEFVN